MSCSGDFNSGRYHSGMHHGRCAAGRPSSIGRNCRFRRAPQIPTGFAWSRPAARPRPRHLVVQRRRQTAGMPGSSHQVPRTHDGSSRPRRRGRRVLRGIMRCRGVTTYGAAAPEAQAQPAPPQPWRCCSSCTLHGDGPGSAAPGTVPLMAGRRLQMLAPPAVAGPTAGPCDSATVQLQARQAAQRLFRSGVSRLAPLGSSSSFEERASACRRCCLCRYQSLCQRVGGAKVAIAAAPLAVQEVLPDPVRRASLRR